MKLLLLGLLASQLAFAYSCRGRLLGIGPEDHFSYQAPALMDGGMASKQSYEVVRRQSELMGYQSGLPWLFPLRKIQVGDRLTITENEGFLHSRDNESFSGKMHRLSVIGVSSEGKDRVLTTYNLDTGKIMYISDTDLNKGVYAIYVRKGESVAVLSAKEWEAKNALKNFPKPPVDENFVRQSVHSGFEWLSLKGESAGREAEAGIYNRLNRGDELSFIDPATGQKRNLIYVDLKYGKKEFIDPATQANTRWLPENRIRLSPEELNAMMKPNSVFISRNPKPEAPLVFNANLPSVISQWNSGMAAAHEAAGPSITRAGLAGDFQGAANIINAGQIAQMGHDIKTRQAELDNMKAARGIQYNSPYVKGVVEPNTPVASLVNKNLVMTVHRSPELGAVEKSVRVETDGTKTELVVRAKSREEAAAIFAEIAEAQYADEIMNSAPMWVRDRRMDMDAWNKEGILRPVNMNGLPATLREASDPHNDGNIELRIDFGVAGGSDPRILRSIIWGQNLRSAP